MTFPTDAYTALTAISSAQSTAASKVAAQLAVVNARLAIKKDLTLTQTRDLQVALTAVSEQLKTIAAKTTPLRAELDVAAQASALATVPDAVVQSLSQDPIKDFMAALAVISNIFALIPDKAAAVAAVDILAADLKKDIEKAPPSPQEWFIEIACANHLALVLGRPLP